MLYTCIWLQMNESTSSNSCQRQLSCSAKDGFQWSRDSRSRCIGYPSDLYSLAFPWLDLLVSSRVTQPNRVTYTSIRHTSGISGGFRQLRIYVLAVMADFETFVMRPKEDTARDKLIPRKLVRQSRGDTKEEDVICYHSAHCRQILSIKTPLSSPSNSRII